MVSKKHITKTFALMTVFALLLAGCGGAPANNPNLGGNSGDTVDDGIIVLKFVSATPDAISLKGQGKNEASVVTFQVTNTANEPLAGISVQFSLDTTVGGVELRGNPVTASDVEGLASITVASGTVSTVVHVIAQIPGTDTRLLSNDITIATGIPVFGYLAVGAEQYKARTATYVGETVEIAVVASDQFGNHASSGTRISLWSPYYGSIDSSCTVENGACAATWLSTAGAGLILPNDTTDTAIPALAYANGAEFFVDSNGNNIYEDGETFADLGEAYLDANSNGAFDSDEFFVDSNSNGVRDEGNGRYDGPCPNSDCDASTTVTIWKTFFIYICPDPDDFPDGLLPPCGDLEI